jgi:putative DNA methylase
VLSPKAEELIASPYRHGGSRSKAGAFFEQGLGIAIGHWRKGGCSDYPTTVFYAFRQTETTTQGTASTGWETFLTGLIDHGFAVTGTWPFRTEREKGLKGNVNALASSVVLACIPRESNAPMATRREFLGALKRELPDAFKKLQSGNIAPVDLAQAAIGPGMAVFSRYSKVVESDGAAMTVRTALTLINQSLDEVLAEQEGEFDADTRWAVAWFEQHGTQEGPYGVAETLSKAKNTSVAGLVEAGLVAARGGKVKLLGRDAMPDGWDPTADKRPTCWEAAQHLIRRLQTQGEPAAADLLARLGADYGETARDLAYRLYSICERKKWADEALAYNGLVIAWPELVRLALRGRERQEGLFE